VDPFGLPVHKPQPKGLYMAISRRITIYPQIHGHRTRVAAPPANCQEQTYNLEIPSASRAK
jgi:hypothetical protein